jgi:hypothetical protein
MTPWMYSPSKKVEAVYVASRTPKVERPANSITKDSLATLITVPARIMKKALENVLRLNDDIWFLPI